MTPKKAKGLVSPDGKSIYVGVNHDAEFKVPRSIAEQLLSTGDRYGFWYEGNGGDRDKVGKALGNIPYKGSWDELLESKSPIFYYAMFSNGTQGTLKLINKLEEPSKTILEVLEKAGDGVAHEALHGYTSKAKLRSFLQEVSPSLLLSAEKTKATKPALKEFFAKGESLMWPSNWREGPTSASRLALKANKARLQTILARDGVFFLGEDHLQTLKSINPNLKLLAKVTQDGN